VRTRPLYQWKSFWLGIAVLGLLVVCWLRSTTHKEGFACCYQDSSVSVEQKGGYVTLMWGKPNVAWRFRAHSQPFSGPLVLGRAWSSVTAPGTGSWLFIAHWFLFLLFLLPWSAFLALRWMRQKRDGKPMAVWPVCRWKSFWAGVFILVFLGWAWNDSRGTYTRYFFRVPGSFTCGAFRADGASFFLVRATPFDDGRAYGFDRDDAKRNREGYAATLEKNGFSWLMVRDDCLFLFWLGAFGVALRWKWKREQGKLAG
jgi:hypothetical protein